MGKLAAIVLSITAIGWIGRGRWTDYGVTFRQRPGTGRRAAGLVLGTIGVLVALAIALAAAGVLTADDVRSETGAPFWEGLFFQFLLVGIAEELAYRGVLQSLLDGALAGTRRFCGADLGWGFAIAVLAFTFGHVLEARTLPTVRFVFNPAAFAMVPPFALLAGYLRSYTGSLLWPIVLHGLADGLGDVVGPAIAQHL
jgi:membrane protease YdiL (CAAX protease family)